MSAWRSLSTHLKEIRLHLSQTAPGSQGVREFVKNTYPAIKRDNPAFPILIREAANVEARVFGRYALGLERKVQLEGLTESEVASRILELAQTKPSATQH
ncbi:NADH:ubiquinone oxidoreductase 11 kDa subunit [Polychytrium aggregatum]|uniref:NADH:ubiquinone oxidoreductase 11 kDa subunit n=1 Tax=Polychytrium aggregatum TaxID=110093 RepID=UPI0022FDCA7D|nr:NADH:ubiquinone oxidoreductase 11 kDa subunit [Polychytrium aggregatum]KAI9209308.1 NADH:ubiquinone oxidoreductase 11 kDa subunit [Polychytrium aggregatum]